MALLQWRANNNRVALSAGLRGGEVVLEVDDEGAAVRGDDVGGTVGVGRGVRRYRRRLVPS
jgi:hypothetical protein